MTFKQLFTTAYCICVAFLTIAQDTISVNAHFKHSRNGYAEFDRSRHIIFHDDLSGNEWDSDQQKIDLFEGYDVYYGRNNGGIVWEYNNTREDADKPGWPDLDYMESRGQNAITQHANDVGVHVLENRYSNMMIGGQESMYPHGQETSREGLVYADYEATAEFYANYLAEFFGEGGTSGSPKPKFLEVMNEPFVKANKLGTTRENIAKLHNVVAKRVKELVPDVMVGGYSAAHPAFEGGGFNHWNSNWKMFIDVAGENMDFFSFHLYDNAPEGVDNMEALTYRSGSNIQAIMDMINHYSYLRLGETKPWSISEYGFLCSGCEENSPYLEREDWYNLRSFNSMLLQILERQDQIVHSIPFFLLKANWAKPDDAEYNGYQARLMRELGELPGEPAHGGYIYTHLLKFYQFWVDVKGTRIDTWAADPDTQVDGYVDGKNLYVIVNTLEHEEQEYVVDLNGIVDNDMTSMSIKHLYADENEVPVLDTTYYDTFPEKVQVGNQATIIIKCTFENELAISETNNESTYFANQYFQPISSGITQRYQFDGVTLSDQGEAILRLGMGRDHGKSLQPTVSINGTNVKVPKDWRGYDQLTRDSFFGVVEFPIPHDLLKKQVTVDITFNDAGGYVTSLGLQVFNFSAPLVRPEPLKKEVLSTEKGTGFNIYPNPAKDVLNIRLPDKTLHETFAFYDMAGRKQLSGNLKDQIDLSKLANGCYHLTIQSKDETFTHKIIKR